MSYYNNYENNRRGRGRGRGNNNNFNNRGRGKSYTNNNRGRSYNNNNFNQINIKNNNHYYNINYNNNYYNKNNNKNKLFGKYIISQDYDTIDIDNDLKIIIVKGSNNKIYCSQRVGKLIIKGYNNKFILEDEGKLYYAFLSGSGNEVKCKNYNRLKSTIKGTNNIIITKQKDHYDDDSSSDDDYSDDDDSDLDDYSLDEDDYEFLLLRKKIRNNNIQQGNYYNNNVNLNNNVTPSEINNIFNKNINNKVDITQIKSYNYSNLLPLFKKENKKCQICLVKFRENEIIKLFSCNHHIFHINCIKLWLEKKQNCPICREDFNINKYI